MITNIKNLPEGTYFTSVSHDIDSPLFQGSKNSHVWKLSVNNDDGTKILNMVHVRTNPEWDKNKKYCNAGLRNPREQMWLFDSVSETNKATIKKDENKNWVYLTEYYIENHAIHFHDYNFKVW